MDHHTNTCNSRIYKLKYNISMNNICLIRNEYKNLKNKINLNKISFTNKYEI